MSKSIVLELLNNWGGDNSFPAIQEDECVDSTAPAVRYFF